MVGWSLGLMVVLAVFASTALATALVPDVRRTRAVEGLADLVHLLDHLGRPLRDPARGGGGDRLLEVDDGRLAMLLERGYHDLGLDALLKATEVPKGSFYHHFRSKEDFALQVVDTYMIEVHKGLDATLGDRSIPPLTRARRFRNHGLVRDPARQRNPGEGG